MTLSISKIDKIYLHQTCKIDVGVCPCGESYSHETFRNVAVRWDEDNDTAKKSNPLKYIKDNLHHVFN